MYRASQEQPTASSCEKDVWDHNLVLKIDGKALSILHQASRRTLYNSGMLRIQFLGDMTPRYWVTGSGRFEGPWCLHPQGSRGQRGVLHIQKNGALNHTALKNRTLALWQVLLTCTHTPTSTFTIDTKGKLFFNQHTESRRNRMSYIQYNEGILTGLVIPCVGIAF